MIQEMVKKLTLENIIPRAAEIDEKDEFPDDIVKSLAENGLLKLSLPEKYGGIDADTSTLSIVISELSYGSAPIGSLMLSTQCVIKVIKQYGSETANRYVFFRFSIGG